MAKTGVEAIVVVPTAREASLGRFLEAWQDELAAATILVVEDGPERTFSVAGANVRHFAWCDIDDQLGDAAWIVPRGSGCVAHSVAGPPPGCGRT